jgi:hypothetical protein
MSRNVTNILYKIKELCTKLIIYCYYIRIHGQPNIKIQGCFPNEKDNKEQNNCDD